MKNIYLIGDSIRVGTTSGVVTPGYELFVRKKCDGKYGIYSPEENSRFAQYTLRNLYEWVSGFDTSIIDVIHWNNGLWDVLRLNGDDPLTPIDMYELMLRRIIKKMRLLFPNAKIIFATTTPVCEEAAPENYMRYNCEIEKYNDVAQKIMEENNIYIDDLYSTAKKINASYYADWTHFNSEGAEILAEAVVKSIEKALA